MNGVKPALLVNMDAETLVCAHSYRQEMHQYGVMNQMGRICTCRKCLPVLSKVNGVALVRVNCDPKLLQDFLNNWV